MSNAGTVASFLQSKGLPDVAIAGVLGNLQVESGISPTAYNAKEQAIGLAQWELGRRTNLQAYAKAHGGKETDLSMQLGYLWSELTGSYSGALTHLKSATSAAQAATIWDAEFEHSAGTTRAERIAAANAYAKNGWSGGDSVLAKLWALDPRKKALDATVNAGVGAAQDAKALTPASIGTAATKAGVYLIAFGLGGGLIVLGLNKAAGNPAGKITGAASHLPIPV